MQASPCRDAPPRPYSVGAHRVAHEHGYAGIAAPIQPIIDSEDLYRTTNFRNLRNTNLINFLDENTSNAVNEVRVSGMGGAIYLTFT